MSEKKFGDGSWSGDQVFINKLKAIVLANLSNEHFNVERLAREAGMSRTTIHRRLKLINNKHVTQFIREIRLIEARKLLLTGTDTVSEIAYKVGFSSSAYFARCFREYYGYTPREVRNKNLLQDRKALQAIKSPPVNQGLPVFLEKPLNKKVISGILALIFIIALIFIYDHYLIGKIHIAKVFSSQKDDLSIIILPFKNYSQDTGNLYFADGIREDILNNLFYISNMKVVSRTTSEYFRGTDLTVKEIARRVDVRNVLEGSVRRYGDKIRINVQLIDASSDQHLWSATFDRDLHDIIEVQHEVAMQVALNLDALIRKNEMNDLRSLPSENSEAYGHYFKGRYLLHRAKSKSRFHCNEDSLAACIKYFEKAIAEDDLFAEAYAGVAHAWFILSSRGLFPAQEGFPKSLQFSMKALEIDPYCAEAHAIKGACHVWWEHRFEEGRRQLQTALHLNPNFPYTHLAYTRLLMITGPIEAARTHIDYCLKLDPFILETQHVNAWICYFEGKYDRALDACCIVSDLEQGFPENNWLYFLNYAQLDEGEKAMKALQTIVQKYSPNKQYVDEVQKTYDSSGMEGLFTWLIRVNSHEPLPVEGLNGNPYFIAWWHALLKHKEESLYWLQKNLESNTRPYFYSNFIATNPDFDFLRDDPRFLEIIDALGLSPYHIRAPK